MKIFGYNISFEKEVQPKVKADYSGYGVGSDAAQGAVYAVYDGETSIGEMGPPIAYAVDFATLRTRSRQLYIENPLCQTVVNRFTEWVVGKNLRLQAEPQNAILVAKGIKIDTEAFNNRLEALWTLYANSKMADYANQQTLTQLTKEAHRESKIAGDMLVVLRVVGTTVKVQHIDARHVSNPPNLSIGPTWNKIGGDSMSFYYTPTGNRVRNGVEIDDKGEHVAYHVHVGNGLEYVRVKARYKGFLMAYMIYGKKNAIDDTRGMTLLSVVMETAKKLDRYTASALAGAEVRQDIPMFIEHGPQSNNEDPLAGRRVKALSRMQTPEGDVAAGLPVDAEGNNKAKEAAVSTKRTVINLGNDTTIKAIDSRQELDVPGFAMFHVDVICAAVNIPPNVAMCKYEDSFSASRMAGKDWEHTFTTERADFTVQYLNPIKNLQQYVWTLNNELQAPGYLNAMRDDNELVIEAYNYCRWDGDMFPDIDPLKTVKYLREALGPAAEHAPLISLEYGAEVLGQGNYSALAKQVGKELENVKDAGIKPVEKTGQGKLPADEPPKNKNMESDVEEED